MASSSSSGTAKWHATALVVNTLTKKPEDLDARAWLKRNGFDNSLLPGTCTCTLKAEFGYQMGSQGASFTGMTFGWVEIDMPANTRLSTDLQEGIEFGESKCQLPQGYF